LQVAGAKKPLPWLFRRVGVLQSIMAFPPLPAVSDKDKDHVLLLSIFHFILAGMGVLYLAFLVLHYAMMHAVFSNPHMWDQMKDNNGHPVQMPFNPTVFFNIFVWFYVFMGAWGITSIVLNLAAGLKLRQWQSRTFVLCVAGFNCINIPFGTVLGVFTIVVLTRDSMRGRFDPV
jgi:hypothetical protein